MNLNIMPMHSPALDNVQHSAISSINIDGLIGAPFPADSSLTIKATQTGIVFLSMYDTIRKKYWEIGQFRERYTGSKQFDVVIDGDNGELVKKKKPAAFRPAGSLNDNIVDLNNGQISEKSSDSDKKVRKKSYTVNKRQVRQRLLGYINTMKGKKELYFFTTTFPQNTPDAVCYQALNTWLTSLRKYKILKEYLWVAERQKNGTIHFHMAVPHKMPVQRANSMMRGTLKNLAKAGAIPYKPHSPQIAKYNGVDISKNRKTGRVTNFAIKKGTKSLVTYLTKYVTKNDAEFEFLAWHNSRGFSALFTAMAFTVFEFKEFGFNNFLNREKVYRMNFAVFVPWLGEPPPLLREHLYELNSFIQTLQDGTQTN